MLKKKAKPAAKPKASTMKKVEWFKAPKSLAEEYQQTGIHFTFVSAPKDGSRVCHEWVKCRDFLPDAARTQVTGKPSSIYGFTFDVKKNPPVDMKKMRILVSREGLDTEDKRHEFIQMMTSALKVVNYYESVAGVSLSKMYRVDPEGQTRYNTIVMFVGPLMWMTSPVLISMYTFILRLGHKKLTFKDGDGLRDALKNLQGSGLSDKDVGYLKASWDKMEDVIRDRAKLFPKKKGVHDLYWKDININSFHHKTGLLCLANGNTPDQELNKRMKEAIPVWQQKRKR